MVVGQAEGNQTEVSRSEHFNFVDMVVGETKFFQVVGQVLDFGDVVVRQIQNLQVLELTQLGIKS